MKTLSLYQPWAGWVVEGKKTLELRRWTTRYRGPLLIHASCNINLAACVAYGIDPAILPTGALVGVAELVDIIHIDKESFDERSEEHLASGFFEPPMYGWRLANPRELRELVPWRGWPGLFEVPERVLEIKQGSTM